jgi:septum formation inhibitor-activating ATPase MinD
VSWNSKAKSVVKSSTEGEYVALAKASNEAMHLQNFVREILGNVYPVTVCCDNREGYITCRMHCLLQKD